MKNYQTIAVALDLTGMDEALLKNAAVFHRLSGGTAEMYFIHVIPSFVFPGNVEDLVHGITSPGYQLDTLVEAKISKEISEVFGEKAGTRFEIVVREGNTLKTVVELTRKVKAGLLLAGKKKVSEGSGIVSKMIARHVESAICFITETGEMDLENIVVPMDFSPYAVRALEQALHLKAHTPGAKIHVLHVLDYPPTTEYLTRHYGLLAPDWEDRIEAAFTACLQQNKIEDPSIHFTSIKNDLFDTAAHIRDFATGVKAGLIVTGAKGHSAFDDLFLGSVTEKLVTIVDEIPVLIVR